MSTLRCPSLGPIIGHTTSQSCRIWIAASDALDERGIAEDRRTIGVLAVVGADGLVGPNDIFYFRLRREYARTGTFNLGVDKSLWKDPAQAAELQPLLLQPATRYTIRVACLNQDDAYPNDSLVTSEALAATLPPASVWRDKLNNANLEDEAYAESTFVTQPVVADGKPPPISFFVGSCRYPGVLWKRKEADRIFGPMLEQHSARPVNLALMVGDQIYADLLNRKVSVALADSYEEFQERYHTAFGSRNMRQLLSQIPTYMILDDHEIEDNWSQDRIKDSAKRQLFNLAIGAYMNYQWSHGPRFTDSFVHEPAFKDAEALKFGSTINLHYDFACAGYPFYVLDTRTQRYTDRPGLTDNHLLGRPPLSPNEPSQLDRVCAWLRHMQQTRGNVPKFIVSSTVFLPNEVNTVASDHEKEQSDSWSAFPTTRRALLQSIVKDKVQNVVFLSGDIHCSNISRLEFTGPGAGLRAYSVVSSAFYWPWPFADGEPAGYVHDSRDPRTLDAFQLGDDLGELHYRTWSFTQEDNFCRVDVDPHNAQLLVAAYDKDGTPIKRFREDGVRSELAEALQLEPWL